MTEQDADLLKVPVGQVTKDRDIDSVLGKTLREATLNHDDPSIVEPLTSARDVRTQPLQSDR